MIYWRARNKIEVPVVTQGWKDDVAPGNVYWLQKPLPTTPPSFHTDPGDLADHLRSAIVLFISSRSPNDHDWELQNLLEAADDAAEQLDHIGNWRTFWVMIALAQWVALVLFAVHTLSGSGG